MNALYKQVQSQQTEENKTEKNFEAFIDSKRVKLLEKIKMQIKEYIRYCKGLSIEEFLDDFGNDAYRIAKKKGCHQREETCQVPNKFYVVLVLLLLLLLLLLIVK